MIALYLIGGYLLLAFVTFIFFMAIMQLKQRRDGLPPAALYAGYAVFWMGWTCDVAFNVASTFLFLDLPRELLFTSRVSRLKKTTGWRSKLAHWFCANLLEPIDPGHCK